MQVGDGAILGDGSGENHGAFLMHGAGKLRVLRDDLAQEQSLGKCGRQADRGRGGRMNDGGRRLGMKGTIAGAGVAIGAAGPQA